MRRVLRALGLDQADEAHVEGGHALARLQRGLFAPTVESGSRDASVELSSAPGESRECVEIARRVLREAAHGTPFDRMAVLAHGPERYRAHLTEALRRARIPAYFTRGTLRPDPAGRALLALLDCREQGLSARAFAEYLSLGVVPDASEDGAPPEAALDVPWLAPDRELVALPEPDQPEPDQPEIDRPAPRDRVDAEAPVVLGTLRAPWRWERLIVDAAVIGGLDRWQRRLDGLERELAARGASLKSPDEPIAISIARKKEDLRHLRAFALPLLEQLALLPTSATWGVWGEHLARLAERALRDPARVLAVLRELAARGPIGAVGVTEVRLVLSRRLTEMVRAPSGSPAGKLFVASIEEARGLSFEVVFVPGLAERIFPRKVIEDPIALDAVRASLGEELPTSTTRVEHERLALRLAAGAAERKLVLSYPRIDTERARPQVPSFYGLEVLRAIEGALPGFEHLARRAEEEGASRLAWPAPEDPDDAIDVAEYDLAVLDALLREPTEGAMRYVLSINPHLARALRARWMRWSTVKWTSADGLVGPSATVKTILSQRGGLASRPYSATALESFAACPYRFYLRAVLGLAPREDPAPLEEIDPSTRGRLFHDSQFELLSRLRDAGGLPVREARLPEAYALLEQVVREVAARHREELVPAISRIWEDGVASVHADLREWLLRECEHVGWTPSRFELAFGVRSDRSDPLSRAEPVSLEPEGIALRGAIDLVEAREGRLRATDHKTGQARAPRGVVIDGGRVLQPLLYARALEVMFPEQACEGGRLYYCTARGGFEERVIPLDDGARATLRVVADTVRGSIEQAFLPAAPMSGECQRCDYRAVCGPAEERRTASKQPAALAPLTRLRRQR